MNLNREIATHQRRVERCYVDHLDGKVSSDEWESRTALWKAEQDDLRLKLMGPRPRRPQVHASGRKALGAGLAGAQTLHHHDDFGRKT